MFEVNMQCLKQHNVASNIATNHCNRLKQCLKQHNVTQANYLFGPTDSQRYVSCISVVGRGRLGTSQVGWLGAAALLGWLQQPAPGP